MQVKTHKLKTPTGIELTFRDIKVEEAPILKSWMDSSKTAQTIATGWAQSIEQEESWIKKNYENPDKVLIGVEIEGKLIGSWGAVFEGHVVHTGSMIGPEEMRGKGIAKVAHAFRTWLLLTQIDVLVTKLVSEVVWDTSSGHQNIPSRKSLESVGYIVIGTEKGEIFRNGKLMDMIRLECYNPFFHKKSDLRNRSYKQALAKTASTLKWVDENIIRI